MDGDIISMKTVLIADDNKTNRTLLRRILERDYTVIEAASCAAALDILRQREADISAVILDTVMPASDGYDTLKKIRSNKKFSQIPVFISTVSEGDSAQLEALTLGANDFITKPYNAEVILRRVGNVLHLVEATSGMEKLRAEKEALRISEEQYRIAASAGGRVTARYDIATGTYYRSDRPLTSVLFGDTVENVPQAFLDNGVIAPECRADYLAFFSRIRAGNRTSEVDVSIHAGKGVYRWFHCDATVIFDDGRHPSQAIIVYTDITEQREKERVYKKWQQALSLKPPESYTLFRCNLSHNESYESMEGLLLKGHTKERMLTFNMQTREYALQYVHPDDRDRYLSMVNSDILLANYHRDRRMETLEYRELMPEDSVRWLRLTIELVEYPNSTDIEAYLMFEDINEKKLSELRSKALAERDPLTGVLNRTAFIHRANELIQSDKPSQHALMMVDIDSFKKLNDVFGHAAGDRELTEIAAALHSALRHGDLVGRLGGDEFVILMRDIPYDAIIEKKARQVCAIVRKSFSADVQISASIGVAVFPRDGGDFDSLYRAADSALYHIKSIGKDSFAFYDRESHTLPIIGEPSPEDEQIQPAAKNNRRMLIVDDNEINRTMLANMFHDEYIIETASDGASAMVRLHHYGSNISIVLLDLLMPGMDGFAVLEKMRDNLETRSIPVIVVSGQDEREAGLRAIKAGAADYVNKPVDPDLIRLRVESAVSRADSERLRAQNSYLLLQKSEEAKYRTVLDSTGTVVIEFDWTGGVFTYDDSISRHIAGKYDDRRLWQVLLSDMVADTADVQAMQELVRSVADDRSRSSGSMSVRLKTPSGSRQWFRMRIFKRADEFQLTSKLIITFVNINDEVTAEQKLRFQAERDELTGLWNRKTFFEKSAEMIAARKPGYYVMSCFDIDNFKVINDQYGSEKGDEILIMVANVFRTGFEAAGGIVCRITADNFAVLYPASFMHSGKLAAIRENARVLDGSIPPISFCIGRYIADDLSVSISGMYDRATLAQASVKGRFDVNIAQYDETMRVQLINQQNIVNEMDKALEDGQFEAWFQPQYNHATGARIGAEVLVRWRHPERGLIQPNDFIPVFERNGFVYELDKYIWMRTCEYLREWTDEGRSPLPLSINISRYDLLRDDLCETISGLLEKYNIPAELLRLEITESAFARDTDQIVGVVKQLIKLGFTIEIDDFGSGYSSLNTLKDVPAQVLKMDMRFLENTENSDRGGNILESVVRMAKWLGMSVIAEGVESREQADYLQSIGCSYVQGYLYAKPMSADDYIALSSSGGKEEKLLALETVENYDNNSFWNPSSIDTLIFNTYVGGACIFEWSNGHIELLRANEKYAKTIGGEEYTVEEALRIVWEDHMDEIGALATREAIQHTIDTEDDATYEAVYHDLFGNGEDTWLRTTFRVIARSTNRYLLYATNINLTEQRRAEQETLSALDKMRIIMENINGGVSAITFGEDGLVRFVLTNEQFYSLLGFTKEQFNDEVKDVFTLVHPDDSELVQRTVTDILKTRQSRSYDYRCVRRDKQIIYLRCNAAVTNINGVDEAVLLSVIYDITAQVEAERNEKKIAEQMQAIMSSVDCGITAAIVEDGSVNFLFANDRYFEMHGYTREQYTNEVKNAFDLIHPDDLPYLIEATEHINSSGGSHTLEYRVMCRNKAFIWERITLSVTRFDGIESPVQLGITTDITSEMEAAQRIRALNENLQNMMNDMPGGFAQLRVLPGGDLATEYVNDNFCRLRGMTRSEVLDADSGGAMGTIHPDDIPEVRAAVARMISSDETCSLQYRLRHADGHYIPLTVFGRVTRSESGDTHINAYYADMSEQEKKELSLRETMPFILSAIMKSSSDLAFAKDKELTYICCSSAFANMVGLESEADIVGKTDFDLFKDRALAEQYRADDFRLMQGGESLVDYIEPIPSDDGLPRFSSTSKYILRDTAGDIIGLYGTGRDITEYRSAFERLKLLTDSMPGGLVTYVLRPEGLRVSYFNDGLCRLFGCTREEYAEATKDSVITTVFKDDIPRLQSQIQRMIKDGTPVNCTCRMRSMQDDSCKWVNIRATPVEYSGGMKQAHAVFYDVTEQKLAEEAALVHEAEMRLAISRLGKVLCEYDPVLHVLTVPEAYAQRFGTSSRIEDMPERLIRDGFISEDTLDAYQGFYTAILRGDRTGSAEFRSKDADGNYRWEHTEFYSIPGDSGKPVKAIISIEDTTKQHTRFELEQARPTLGEENLMVHALFNLNTGETLDYAYRDGREVPPDERSAFLFGGDNLASIIIDNTERKRYRELNDPKRLIERFENGETELSIDYRRRLPGGDIVWARNLLRLVREPGGNDILLFEYCYNIEREKTLELMYGALVRENYDYVARINGKNGHFRILANAAIEYGMPPGSGEDIDAAVLDIAGKYIHPDDRELVKKNATLAGMKENLISRDRHQFAFRLLHTDGNICYKRLTVYYLDREREIIIAAREDISELIQEEARKNKLLSDALDAANQASRAKTQFLSRMSHELRTPMNAIIGLSALSAGEVDNPRAMEDAIGKIGMSARYLLSLINDILEMSRIESGKMALNEAPFDFERMISEVNNVIYAQAEEKGLDYDAIVNGYTEASYVGDSLKLQQVLMNVLGNAVKFTPTGGKVTLAIEQIKRTKKGATLRFTITDTGIGIDEEFLPHLFDPFSQESGSMDSFSSGTGLGLAITKNIVDLMNGKITVKSIKDIGSVFTIIVSLGITKESEQYLDMAASMKLDLIHVLVVDDDVTVCRSTYDMLKSLGMQSEWAESGHRALDCVEAAHKRGRDFDTVILDWKMPDMDGIETARRIRALVGPDVTIIIMTAYDWRSIEAEAREAGVDLFMEKPLFQSSIIMAFEQVFMVHRVNTEPSPPSTPDLSGRRIMVVEDNPINTEVAKRLVEKTGAQVTVAANGLEALEIFTTEAVGYFDAILMDIRMPVMDGLTAAKSIRRLKKPGSATVPIIAMTANAFDEDVELSLSSGMNAHLVKPIDPQLMFSTLARLILK